VYALISRWFSFGDGRVAESESIKAAPAMGEDSLRGGRLPGD
jgi:hypothetical protein